MNIWRVAILFAAVLAATSCTSTFRVSKDGKGYFLGSNSNAIYTMLCESGDLEKIISDAKVSREKQDDLYKYNCSKERSSAKVKQIYGLLTPDERKSLRIAFKKNGYDINAMTC